MQPASLECKKSPTRQRVGEAIAYSVRVPSSLGTPSSPLVKVWNETTGTDVTAVVMPVNSPSVSGQRITTSKLQSLTAGHVYRIDVQFDAGGNTFIPYIRVFADG